MKDLSMYGELTDYPSSLVMSGVESDSYFDIAVNEGIDRMLMSYLYIRRLGKDFLRDRLKDLPHIKMMIDSGAHTFHAKEDEYIDKPLSWWENYIESYIDFVRENKEFIFSCVELDVGNLLGLRYVDYFREKFFEPLKEEGILVCYVWHNYDGIKMWEEMCKKYDYVGFSLTNSSATRAEIVNMINIAKRHGALVHGFAVTRTELMSNVPFYTGDSSVTGDSLISVRDKQTKEIKYMSIEDFFNIEDDSFTVSIDHKEITKFVEGYETLTLNDDLQTVWKDLNSVVQHQVKKEMAVIKTRGGRTIECTSDESLIVLGEDMELHEKSPIELRKGDFLLGHSSSELKDNDLTHLRVGNREINLTDDLLSFLTFASVRCKVEPSDSQGILRVMSVRTKELQDIINNACSTVNMSKRFVPLAEDYYKNSANTSMRVDDTLIQLMLSNGFKIYTGTKATYFIPPFIFKLSKRQIIIYLRVLFSTLDLKKGYEIENQNKAFIYGIIHLLQLVGISANVYIKNIGDRHNYNLRIMSNAMKLKFLKTVGYLGDFSGEIEEVEKFLVERGSKLPKVNLVPSCYLTEDKLTKSRQIDVADYDSYLDDRLVTDSRPLFLEIADISFYKPKTYMKVYDLSVKDTEKFIANGIVVHNTTWLVGTQYGELNWFDGQNMKRLKKEKWKERKNDYESIGAVWELAENENPYELIRINLIVFRMAEEYIRRRIKSKQYWVRPKSLGVNSARRRNKRKEILSRDTRKIRRGLR